MTAFSITALAIAGVFLVIGALSIHAARTNKPYNVTFEDFITSSKDLGDLIVGLAMGIFLATFGVVLKLVFGHWGARGIYIGQSIICFVLTVVFIILAGMLR
jgi:hypothetical protein